MNLKNFSLFFNFFFRPGFWAKLHFFSSLWIIPHYLHFFLNRIKNWWFSKIIWGVLLRLPKYSHFTPCFFENVFDTVGSRAIYQRGMEMFNSCLREKFSLGLHLYDSTLHFAKNQSLLDIQTSIRKILTLPHRPLYLSISIYIWGASVQKPTNPFLVFFDFLMAIDGFPKTTHYSVKNWRKSRKFVKLKGKNWCDSFKSRQNKKNVGSVCKNENILILFWLIRTH